jgi:signal peptidase I
MDQKGSSFKDEAIDFLKDLAIIIIIVVLVRTFIAMPFQINGQSMYESYYDREFIIVDRFSYLIWNPDRGDVVVFKPHVSDTKEYFLKRIVGLWWDTLKIENGEVFLKKKWESSFTQLDEKYLSKENKWNTSVNWGKEKQEYIIPEGEYFVMWDNRNHSSDSRVCFSRCDKVPYSIKKPSITWKVFLDFGYFDFRTFSFLHPDLGIDTKPRFFNSPSIYTYE